MKWKCVECGHMTLKWIGMCSECKNWNTFIELNDLNSIPIEELVTPKSLSEIVLNKQKRFQTGIREFDRVFGEGICYGSLNFIAGEPGVGKSTLLLSVCEKVLKKNV